MFPLAVRSEILWFIITYVYLTRVKRIKNSEGAVNGLDDLAWNVPFDDFIFDIFMVAPDRPPPKPKQITDPFGNKLPRNVDNNIYDWKT